MSFCRRLVQRAPRANVTAWNAVRYASTLPVDTFYKMMADKGVDFYCGVPDSLLKSFCAYVTDKGQPGSHVITANEGTAVAMAGGYHLATGKVGCVYLQNSGLGNTINPLLSLCDTKVYQLPLLMLVGWRGEPGVKDEPQHVAQGALTGPMLDSMGYPYSVLPADPEEAKAMLDQALAWIRDNNAPYTILVQKGTFGDYKMQRKDDAPTYEMKREDAVKKVLDALGETDIVVSTTGMTSREVFEHRAAVDGNHSRDFLTVGCMGHSSAIAAGIALFKRDRQVMCLDGDGSVIMHMGGMSTVGQQTKYGLLKNLKHVVINNGAHDSVGGQPTAGYDIEIGEIAKSNGYTTVLEKISKAEDVGASIAKLREATGPALLEILVNKGSRKDLGRPTKTPIENKNAFMEFLSK